MNTIAFKFIPLKRKDSEKSQLSDYDHFFEEEKLKEKQNRSRTIREVLEKVKEWRDIHEASQGKISLSEAAEMLKMSKRTL